jgi:hypothetical protein
MHSLYKWLLSSFATITLVGFVETATAGVIINIAESNGNVVATVSGSLAYLGLGTVNAPINSSGGAGIGVNFGGADALSIATPGTYGTTTYAMTGPALAWGNSPSVTTANNFSLTGTTYFLFYAGQSIDIGTYNFGDPINATMTFENTTLVTLGLVNLGTYNYTVGSGLDVDTISVNIVGGAAVPEPSALAIVSIGAAAAAIRARRKAKAKA